MPTNVTFEYKAAEATYKAARELPERITALQEMLRVIPKHKGTDHLCGQLKKKLSQLKEEQRTAGKKGGGRRADPGHVPSQGAGQVVLLGPPNSGKSALLAAMTNAEPEVAGYPFTTRVPLPGMARFEDAPMQLVDAPATEHGAWQPWMASLLRNADLGLLVLDPGAVGVLDALETAAGLVASSKLRFVPAWCAVREVAQEDEEVDEDVELSDEELLDRLEPGRAELPLLIVGNKVDLPGRADDFEVLTEFLGEDWPMLAVSARTGDGLGALATAMWRGLRTIRIYSKPPGKPPSMAEPLLLPVGATVRDLARLIHKDLAERLRFARIWGEGCHDGQKIPREHVLSDRDIVEIHA